MAARLGECLAIIAQIQNHFVEKGWQPLLQVKVNGLKTLSYEKLNALLPLVLAAGDRMAAVTAILEAIIPGITPPLPANPAKSESSEWDILQLRPEERRPESSE